MSSHDKSPDHADDAGVVQTWTRLEGTWFTEQGQMEALAIHASRLTLIVFLCGFFLRSNDWIHIGWLLATLPVVFAITPWNRFLQSLKGDMFPILGAAFLGWMTLRSLVAPTVTPYPAAGEAVVWFMGTVLLIGFAAIIWQAAGDAQSLEQAGRWVGLSAAFAALLSMFVFYIVLPDHSLGERLMNWFVYGGLNPVITGLTMGFASLWLACIREGIQSRNERHLYTAAMVVLLVAVFFTRSRGALLALLAGYAALIMIRGFKRSRTPLLIFAGTAIVFQCSGPTVSRLSELQTAIRTRAAFKEANAQDFVGPPPIYHNPVQEMINRWDSGRFEIYEAGRDTLGSGLAGWMTGIGQWCTEDLWLCSLDGHPNHLHSAFLATLVHGGLIGLGLLLALLAVGIRRLHFLALAGQDTWLILLCFGLASMLFDGQTFTNLISMPRMESFLVVFPLVAGVAAYKLLRQGQDRLSLER